MQKEKQKEYFMSIENVNRTSMESQIHSIATSGDAGSRKGRIEILEKVIELGREVLDNLNQKDVTLVEVEGELDKVSDDFEELEKQLKEAEGNLEKNKTNLTAQDARIAELERKADSEKGLPEDEQKELDMLYALRAAVLSDANNNSSLIKDLGGQVSEKSAKMESYNNLLSDLVETMSDYADAGDAVKDAASQFGRPKVAENAENVMKRNESMWGKDWIWGATGAVAVGGATWGVLAICAAGPVGWIAGGAALVGLGVGALISHNSSNDTEKLVDRMGYKGLNDGTDGADLTYHDDISGGYKAEFDVMQYNVGGKLRRGTVETYSIGKTVNTAAEDMARRAGEIMDKKKSEET